MLKLGLGISLTNRIGAGGGGVEGPASLFDAGENGAWYDPSDLSTLFQNSNGTGAVTSDGDPVGYMADKSGNANHVTAATTGERPIYRTDGSSHWLEFDGTDDLLTSGSLASNVFSSTSGFLAVAAKSNLPEAVSGVIEEIAVLEADNQERVIIYLDTRAPPNNRLTNYATDGTGRPIDQPTEISTDTFILSAYINGSNFIGRVDGSQVGTVANGSANFTTTTRIAIGRQSSGDLYLNGNFYGAVIGEQTDLASVEIAETYLEAAVAGGAPTYSFAGFADGTFFANAEDAEDSSVDLYFTIDQEAIGDEPSIAQLVAGQDQTGAAADFSQGPTTVSTGIVDLDLDISGLAEGDYIFRSIAKDSDGNYSPILNEEITVDIPFVDDFNRADGSLDLSSGWDRLDVDNDGDMEIVSNQLSYVQVADNANATYRTVAEKPADQYIEFDVVDSDDGGSFSMELYFYLRRNDTLGNDGYEILMVPTDGAQGTIYINNLSGGGSVSVAGRPFGGDRFLLEAQGDQIRVKRDGAVILSATDTTYTTGGRARTRFFFGPTGPTFIMDNFTFGAL